MKKLYEGEYQSGKEPRSYFFQENQPSDAHKTLEWFNDMFDKYRQSTHYEALAEHLEDFAKFIMKESDRIRLPVLNLVELEQNSSISNEIKNKIIALYLIESCIENYPECCIEIIEANLRNIYRGFRCSFDRFDSVVSKTIFFVSSWIVDDSFPLEKLRLEFWELDIAPKPFEAFFEAMAQNKTIKDFYFVFMDHTKRDNPVYISAFCVFAENLSKNKSIKKLEIESILPRECLSPLLRGLSKNQSVVDFSLVELNVLDVLSEDTTMELEAMFASNTSLLSLCLDYSWNQISVFFVGKKFEAKLALAFGANRKLMLERNDALWSSSCSATLQVESSGPDIYDSQLIKFINSRKHFLHRDLFFFFLDPNNADEAAKDKMPDELFRLFCAYKGNELYQNLRFYPIESDPYYESYLSYPCVLDKQLTDQIANNNKPSLSKIFKIMGVCKNFDGNKGIFDRLFLELYEYILKFMLPLTHCSYGSTEDQKRAAYIRMYRAFVRNSALTALDEAREMNQEQQRGNYFFRRGRNNQEPDVIESFERYLEEAYGLDVYSLVDELDEDIFSSLKCLPIFQESQIKRSLLFLEDLELYQSLLDGPFFKKEKQVVDACIQQYC